MPFSYSHFTLGQKWSGSSASYVLTDTSRATSRLAAEGYTYDSSYGVKPWGITNAAIIADAFSGMLGAANFSAYEWRSGWSNISQVNITISLVKNLQKNGSGSGGVRLRDPATGNVAIVYDIDDVASWTLGSAGFQLIMHEIGHSLGLVTEAPKFHPDNFDNTYTHDNTVMSYTAGTQVDGLTLGATAASTAMLYDIVTLQKLYGVSTADPTDSYAPTGAKKAWTLWDASGSDTLDISGLSWTAGQPGAKLDLRGGADANNVPRFIEIKDERIAIAFDPRHYTNGDITQPLLPGKSGVVDIEVAKGGLGNDTLIGGALTYSMEGGGGNDLIISAHNSVNGDGAYHMRGGAGNDVLWSTADDRLYGGADSDTYWLNNAKAYDGFNSGTNTFYVYGGQSNSITLAESLFDPANTVKDTIKVFPGARVGIIGGGDNDVLMMGDTVISGTFYRNDAIWGSSEGVVVGSWRLKFSSGTLTVSDLAGSMAASVAMNGQTQPGGSIDYKAFGITIKGAQYGTSSTLGAMTVPSEKPTFLDEFNAKPILPAPTSSSIQGSAFNDVLQDQPGNQTFTLYGGVDTVIVKAAASVEIDTLADFAPIMGEKIDLRAYGSSLALNINQTGNDASFVVGGNHTIVMKNVSSSALSTSNFVGVASLRVAVTPTSGSDSLTGSSGADTIDALGGNDTISGLGGNDSLIGNSGDDVLIGGAGADTLSGGTGTDTASYATSAAAVTVALTTGTASGGDAAGDSFLSVENLIGSAYNDRLTGTTSSNLILGGGGNDTILGDSGNDTLDGEAGNDSIDGGSGNDLIYGGAGSDAMIGGAGTDTLDYSRSTAAVILNLATGAASGGYAAGDTLSGAEHVIGSNYNDSVTGSAENNSLLGGLGNDTLRGDAGRDTIDGGDGNDSIYGGTDNDKLTDLLGNNKLFGEAGNDTLTGGAGADSLDGGDGDDVLEGGAGGDTLVGGLGVDTLTYANATAAVSVNLKAGTGTGAEAAGDKPSGIEKLIGTAYNDTLTGGTAGETIDGGNGNNALSGDAGADSLKGGSGLDSMDGGAGNDTLDGGSGNDSLRGGADADEIDGGTGNDLLFGDAGADTLDGGSGADTMNGGTEGDIFYIATSDTGLGTAADHIVGFSRTQGDKIDLNMSGISASGFVGTGAFASGGVKEFGYTKTTIGGANATVIRIDYDNNGVTDREIVLDGIHIDLTAGDFLF